MNGLRLEVVPGDFDARMRVATSRLKQDFEDDAYMRVLVADAQAPAARRIFDAILEAGVISPSHGVVVFGAETRDTLFDDLKDSELSVGMVALDSLGGEKSFRRNCDYDLAIFADRQTEQAYLQQGLGRTASLTIVGW